MCAIAVGWTTEETGALVSTWGQANVQNELDALAHVVSCPRGSPSISKDSVGPTCMYATVDMQSTAEEKQQVAEDQPLGGSVLDTRSLRAWHMHG